MSILKETDRAPAEPRERSDLQRQYRPIGIGAVAAAVAAAGKDAGETPRGAANANEKAEQREWLAA